MCQGPTATKIETQALCYFRFFVYREYREMRFLGNPRIGEYDKFSNRYSELLGRPGGSFARLWHEIASEREPARIRQPFEDLTGLPLQEVEEAFRRGVWQPAESRGKTLGGPYHADIALHTLRLGAAIA